MGDTYNDRSRAYHGNAAGWLEFARMFGGTALALIGLGIALTNIPLKQNLYHFFWEEMYGRVALLSLLAFIVLVYVATRDSSTHRMHESSSSK